MSNAISFMSANYVAREAGWSISTWAEGDRATRDAFAPVETFAERFDAVLADAQALGFDTVDIWGAHLHADWATGVQVENAVTLLGGRGLRVASYATWVTPQTVERACGIARSLGTDLIGGGF